MYKSINETFFFVKKNTEQNFSVLIFRVNVEWIAAATGGVL